MTDLTQKITDHPLTDDLCCQLWQDNKDNWLKLQEPCPATRRVMRASYDLGRDEQLKQVIKALNQCKTAKLIAELRSRVEALEAARRPKPPSLKELALEDLEVLITDLANHGMGFNAGNIRRALEALPDD